MWHSLIDYELMEMRMDRTKLREVVMFNTLEIQRYHGLARKALYERQWDQAGKLIAEARSLLDQNVVLLRQLRPTFVFRNPLRAIDRS